MPNPISDRLRKLWNVFRLQPNMAPVPRNQFSNVGVGSYYRPDRFRMYLGGEQSIVASIYTRIGIDVSAIPIQHVRLDEDGQFSAVIDSGLNNCLTHEANIDQSGRAFIQDVVMSLCSEGVVAIVPVDTTYNPLDTSAYDIITMRTAQITQWFPEHVRVNLYNQATSMKEEITLPKSMVAIIENPLYEVMNETNSTLNRLIAKLNLLDVIDQQSGSGKLDLIIQVPYSIKSQKRQDMAEERRKAIEDQLMDSKYGVAYLDGTEKITQLNRPAENNLMAQIEYLTSMLHSQLGLTESVFAGTADEKEMLNYYNRTVEPILGAVTDGMSRSFLTKTGRSQGQAIRAIRDPFRLVPAEQLAELADKFTRNEILSPNEFRGIVGRSPSKDPAANELRNRNISQAADQTQPPSPPSSSSDSKNAQN